MLLSTDVVLSSANALHHSIYGTTPTNLLHNSYNGSIIDLLKDVMFQTTIRKAVTYCKDGTIVLDDDIKHHFEICRNGYMNLLSFGNIGRVSKY